MGYTVKLTTVVEPGSAGEPSWHEPASCDSLAEASEQAERMAAQPGSVVAVYDDSAGGDAAAEVARYSAAEGWTSGTITPAAWWAELSMPTKEKLRSDPYGEIAPGILDEITAAGGAVLGVPRAGGDNNSGVRLPKALADFVDSERPRL